MKAAVYVVAGALLMSTAACSGWMGGNSDTSANYSGSAAVPFDNGVRTNLAQPTTCSPADSTCGSGVGNPSVQSPTEKRELNASPH